jgi:hypothetical protein
MVARARPIEIALDVKAVDGFGPVVEAGTGRIVVGPEIHADGFAEDEPVFDQVTRWPRPPLLHPRHPRFAAGHAPLGDHLAPSSPDDRAARH